MGGTPYFRGTRVPFGSWINHLQGGYTLNEFLKQFTTVDRELAVEALREARDLLIAKAFERTMEQAASSQD